MWLVDKISYYNTADVYNDKHLITVLHVLHNKFVAIKEEILILNINRHIFDSYN